ncbi:MAG: hypothetical protein GX237_10195 [Clostridiales bacterium]|nr:hypothetical protein [Clostridiales bacterium]
MIRKSMLLKKLQDSHNHEKKITGIMGVNSGVGVTFTGILLAHFFGVEKGIPTAYLECNNHQDFNRLQDVYEWCQEDEESFAMDNITYYKNVPAGQISGILNEDYGSYILDFGTDFDAAREEFFRCSTKIIIGDRGIWNLSKIISFLKSTEDIKGSENWIYIIPCADRRTILGMANKTSRCFYGLPYESDPTTLSKKTFDLFQSIYF